MVDRPEHEASAISSALANLTHGVYVLGSRRGREMAAMTASWVSQISDRPPYVAVAVRDDQVDVATHFAETSGEYHDKLYGIPYGQSPNGSPILLDCLAYLDCRVLDTARAGDHTVFIGEVIAGESYRSDYPLLYDSTEYEEALN